MDNENNLQEDTSNESFINDDIEQSSVKTNTSYDPSWRQLKFVPNKKRFIILSTVFGFLEFAGLLSFAYGFLNSNPNGYFELGIFILAPFTGVAISYLVENKKEAIAVSGVTGSITIILSSIIIVLVGKFIGFPLSFKFNIFSHLAIPIIFILIQIAVGYTLARLRKIYYRIGDSTIPRKNDKAMIDELRQSRIIQESEEDFDDEINILTENKMEHDE